MNVFLVIALALTPAFFWMWWYYRKDVYDKEPMRLLALVFLLATPLSVLCGLLEFSIDGGSEARFSENSGLLAAMLFYFAVVGVVEEFAKFFVVYTLAYRHEEFNEPMDGIIYAATAALGFATLENIFFILDEGPVVILLRGPVSTLGHVLFSAMWGAALGMAKFEPDRQEGRRIVAQGLLLAILTHGAFDILISLGKFYPSQTWLSLLVLPFLLVLYNLIAQRISRALHISKFNPRNLTQHLRENGSTAPKSGLPIEMPRRYAPNPNAYRFRGETFAAGLVQETARPCPDCGQPGNLETACQNCGAKLETRSDDTNDAG